MKTKTLSDNGQEVHMLANDSKYPLRVYKEEYVKNSNKEILFHKKC